MSEDRSVDIDDEDEDLDDPDSDVFHEHGDVDPAESGEDVELDPQGYDPSKDPASTPGPPAEEQPTRDIPKLPKSPATIPAWVKQLGNGKIPEDRMEKVAPIKRGYLVPEAAQAWRSFQAAAKDAGFTVTMTGAYRPLEGQVKLFFERYQDTDSGRKTKTYEGRTYWLRQGVADAATPGSSNHGWGCAVDMALDKYGPGAKAVRHSSPFIQWAIANARSHGWSWEDQSEAWHVRYVGGNDSPQPQPLSQPQSQPQAQPQVETTGATPQPGAPVDVSTLPQPELVRGDQGPEVIKLQELCMARGWGKLEEATGLFGLRTKGAVKAMQRAIGAGADGSYGPKTFEKLVAFLSANP
jgi:D-alanyl-D-alanine dipeptidase